jgi:hypothetical protein
VPPRLLILCSILLSPALSLAAPPEALSSRESGLRERYAAVRHVLEGEPAGLPLSVHSLGKKGRVHAEVYGIFDHSFERLVEALRVPANWGEIATLHPNVKASTHDDSSGESWLTFYCGRRFYQPPEEAEPVTYRYRSMEEAPGYLHLLLEADDGPLGTRDHRLQFEAARLEGERTLVRVSYAYAYGTSLRLAEKVYFSTSGRDKVGFTVTGADAKGNPTHVGGQRGAIERNAARYYFAVQAFLDTLGEPEERRLEARIGTWHDLTSPYPKQLGEVERPEYVKQKLEERRKQDLLQRRGRRIALSS